MNYFNGLTNHEAQIELIDHVINNINELDLDSDDTIDLEDLHLRAFNEDYYLIGYYQCEEWLKANYGVFNAIKSVIEYEKSEFGETNTKINSESILNMLTYIIGNEIIYQNLDDTMNTKEAIETLEGLK